MGPNVLALLDVELDAAKLAEVDAMLASVASKVERTRRGRTWNIWIVAQDAGAKLERPYYVSVETIGSLDEEDLQLLVAGERTLESVKERVSIASGLNSRVDYMQIEALAEKFVAMFGGVSGVAVK